MHHTRVKISQLWYTSLPSHPSLLRNLLKNKSIFLQNRQILLLKYERVQKFPNQWQKDWNFKHPKRHHHSPKSRKEKHTKDDQGIQNRITTVPNSKGNAETETKIKAGSFVNNKHSFSARLPKTKWKFYPATKIQISHSCSTTIQN